MSFSFGSNANQSAFGAAAKPTGFGTPLNFGAPTSAPSSTFGGFGSTFGTPAQPQQQQAPAFGSTFGTPVATAAPAFGSTFGTPVASAAPAFGSTFGTPSTSAPSFGAAAPAFGSTFGAQPTAAPNLFGSTATTKPGLFGSTATPSLFSTPATSAPLFGGTTTTAAPSLFGATTSTTPSLFGNTATTSSSLFGPSFGQTTAKPSLFGNTATTGGFNLFGGTTTTTAAPLFGGFGTNANTFGGFGTATNTGFKLPSSQPQQLQQPQGTDAKIQQTLASFYAINLFGDERDDILKKWNMLQACWGTGKAYYNSSQPAVEYDSCNPFYRFKAISYVVIPNMDNADGLVKLLLNKKESELSNQKNLIINGLNSILGNKPNLTVTIVHIKSISDTETEIMITVAEKGVTGASRKIHATDLSTFLNQPMQKQQLSGAGVTFVGPYVMPSKAQLEEYLKEPPPGIDEQMWKAAQVDNPNPQKYLPTPLTGFSNLKKRMLCEEHETGLHRAFLQKVNKEIIELKKKHSASIALIAEQKQKFLQLQHRVLRILVKQESTRKVGLALQPEEEMLRARLEMMHAHLNMPTQFRGKINELLSSCKVMNTIEVNKNEIYKIDPKVQDDMKQFLTMEQNGISHLIKIINNDLRDLKIMSEGMNQMLQNK